MDIIDQQQKQRENHHKPHDQDEKLKQESKQKSPTTSPASPQSTSSSPSHEFSFTISLHSTTTTTSAAPTDHKTKASTSSFAIDLSPADDIFLHGHLLPLHFLPHLPISPRSSTNSVDSFNIPKKDFLHEPKQQQNQPENNACISSNNSIINKNNYQQETKGRKKSKSLSQIILSLNKWRKGYQERRQEDDKEKHKRKMGFEVSQVIKKYAKMVKPLLSFKGMKRDDRLFDRQSYNSYSGNLSLRRDKQVLIGKKGQYSAPASMSTSPTNSGLLVATNSPFSSCTSDSTMEELQAAIQSAIAHCKNSIAKG